MVTLGSINSFWNDEANSEGHPRNMLQFFALTGALFTFYWCCIILYNLIQAIRLHVLSQLTCFKQDYIKKYGKWAVITGSTDGIGFEIARVLAQRGHSIILVGRNDKKLVNCKNLLEREPEVGEVVTVKIDLADTSSANYTRAVAEITEGDRDVGILINNAGLGPTQCNRLHNFDLDTIRNIANVNMVGHVLLTNLLVPRMLRRGKRSLVVNVSSLMSILHTPYDCIYSATKTFLRHLTKQLTLEYKGYPIDFICLMPGGTNTKIIKVVSDKTWANVDPDYLARNSVNALSTGINEFCATPWHGFLSIFAKTLNVLGLERIGIQLILFHVSNISLTPQVKRRADFQVKSNR